MQRGELREILHRAELGHVELTIRRELASEHVVHAHEGHDRMTELGVLRERRPHQQAAVAATDDDRVLWFRVAARGHQADGGGEVIENILFLGEAALVVPVGAKLRAAADVRLGQHETLLDEHTIRRGETGGHADGIAAVPCDDDRVRAIEGEALASDDVDRDLRPVLADGELADDLGVRIVDGRFHRERGPGGLAPVAALGIVQGPRRGLDVRHRLEEHAVPLGRGQPASGRDGRLRRFRLGLAFVVEDANLAGPAELVGQIESRGRHDHDLLVPEVRDQRVRALGDHDVSFRQIGAFARDQGQVLELAERRALPRDDKESVLRAERGLHDAIGKVGDGLPGPFGRAHVEGELAAVALLNGRQHPSVLRVGGELNLGDAWEVFSNLIGVFLGGLSECVRIHLKEKRLIGLGHQVVVWNRTPAGAAAAVAAGATQVAKAGELPGAVEVVISNV